MTAAVHLQSTAGGSAHGLQSPVCPGPQGQREPATAAPRTLQRPEQLLPGPALKGPLENSSRTRSNSVRGCGWHGGVSPVGQTPSPSPGACAEGRRQPDVLVQPERLHGSALGEAHLRELPQSRLIHSLVLVLVQHRCGRERGR